MKPLLSCLAALAALTAAAPAAAQFQKPEHAIEYRKSAMFLIGQHFGRLGAMANGRVPFDAKAAADNAAVVEFVSRLPWPAFGEGTDLGETKAKPAIWKEMPQFREKAQQMQDAVAKLNAAAKTGDLAQLKAAFGPTAQTCKACHDAYREQ